MKVLSNGPQTSRLPRTILGFFYLYFLLHWVTGVVMFARKLGFSAASVARYYLGDPEIFLNPRSFDGLLEVTHFHLFAMGFFFVVFTHLLLYARLDLAVQRLLCWGLALSLFGDIAAGWLVRYVSGGFAWFKLGCFWVGQGLCLVLLIGLVAGLLKARQEMESAEAASP